MVTIMAPISQLTNRISHLPQDLILRSLKAHGFFSSTNNILKILSVSSSISPHFQSLLQQFPNIAIILNDFLLAQEILVSLKKLPDALENESKRKSRKIHSPFCSEIAGDEFKEIDFTRHRPAGEMLAFFWLTHTCMHCLPGITVSKHLANLLHASLTFVQSINILVEDNPSFCTSWSTTLESDLDKWIPEASSAVRKALGSQMQKVPVKDIELGFKDACRLIKNIKVPPSLQDTEALEAEDDSNDEQDDKSNPKIRVSEQRGAGLEERERLKCHFNSFQHHEIQSLSKTIRNVIERDIESQDATSAEFAIYPPYFHEASLIALALATARSIEGTIKFPLSPKSKEYLANEIISNMPRSTYPIWHRVFSDECHVKIPLPSFLKEPISLLFSYEPAETIEDCLPYSLIDWSERCTDWLAGNIHWTRRYINRRVRDCLPREIYHATANPALLGLFGSPVADVHPSNESLSHYINLLGERTLKAYQTACQRVFNKYGAPSNLNKLYSRDDYATSKEQHIAVAEFFRGKMAGAEKTNDYIEYHNWVARYILMLLIVVTGHRKSRDPFYFPWDILIEEDLAFLCDKLTVGSEARFVPIPEWLSSLVLEYRSHLLALSDKLLDQAPLLSKKIRHLACGGDLMALPPAWAGASNANHHADSLGFFFTLNDSYQARTISTANLEHSYSPVYSGKIGEFRKSAANALWESGCSGYQVETFLGHNGDNHSFGESSSWCIEDWATGIRSWQEQYLDTRGWKAIKLSAPSAKYSKHSPLEMPLLRPGNKDSYERRARDNQQAVATAKKVIRDNLPASWFEDKQSAISDTDVRELKSIVEAKLGSDPAARNQVNQALAQEIDRIRKCVGKVSSIIANLTRIEPCPIPVCASRHIRVASEIRNWWVNELGRYSAEQAGAIMRLAEIGISLIIFDALLDKNTWECILDEIACHETRMDHGCLFARDKIEKRHEIYEKSLVLSPVTAALIMGYEQKFASHKPVKSVANEVKQAVNLLLKSTPKATRSETLELEDLIDVFKSWWIIRLPGALYSIAVGDHAGPAADAMTECALFEIPYGSAQPTSRTKAPIAARSSIKSDPEEAWKILSKFIGSAKGKIEDKNASTRYQRRQLARNLVNLESPQWARLAELTQNQQIVFLMLEFLVFLLEEGGEVKKVLRYNAIRTYVNNIQELIKVLWDRNVLDFASEDFDEAYKKAIEIIKQDKSINYGTPLSLFHKFLRSTYDVPESRVVCSLKRGKTLCRASLVTVSQFEGAWSKISSHVQDDGQIIHHSKNFLYLMGAHGMRPKEAIGMRAWHILATNPMVIRAARNAARDLKTDNSLRASYSMLAHPEHEKHFNHAVELSGISPTTNPYIFADTESQGQLYPPWKIGQAVTMSLRMATGNPGVVPYSLRHSVATRLAHWVFKPPRAIPLSPHIGNTMKGSLHEESIFSIFEQGFVAWPFWPDRVGMHLGQAGSDTLLGTYWHSSNVRLAECTWHACENISFTDAQLANMLGRERSAITHQRKRLLSGVTTDAPSINICEQLIVRYANKSGLPSIGEEFASSTPPASKVRRKDEAGTEMASSMWVVYDRLLCDRLAQQLSLAQMAEKAASMDIASGWMAKFIEAYMDIVSQTGFADFEPENSEILNETARRKEGAIKGATERERGVVAAHKLVKSDEGFAQSLREFVALWISRVDSKYPWFVARDKSELQLILQVLAKIGVNNSQLEIRCCNFEATRLDRLLSKEQMASAVVQNQRLSQGPKNIRVSEIGIQVIQEANSKIGDNRDTHRLALILASISRAELGANDAQQHT